MIHELINSVSGTFVVPVLSRGGLVGFERVSSEVQGKLGGLLLWDW